jgi:hypothetical protein
LKPPFANLDSNMEMKEMGSQLKELQSRLKSEQWSLAPTAARGQISSAPAGQLFATPGNDGSGVPTQADTNGGGEISREQLDAGMRAGLLSSGPAKTSSSAAAIDSEMGEIGSQLEELQSRLKNQDWSLTPSKERAAERNSTLFAPAPQQTSAAEPPRPLFELSAKREALARAEPAERKSAPNVNAQTAFQKEPERPGSIFEDYRNDSEHAGAQSPGLRGIQSFGAVRARLGPLRALSVFHSQASLYGGFLWALKALNGPNWRFPAEARRAQASYRGAAAGRRPGCRSSRRRGGASASGVGLERCVAAGGRLAAIVAGAARCRER